jgi:hypothetical protein
MYEVNRQSVDAATRMMKTARAEAMAKTSWLPGACRRTRRVHVRPARGVSEAGEEGPVGVDPQSRIIHSTSTASCERHDDGGSWDDRWHSIEATYVPARAMLGPPGF